MWGSMFAANSLGFWGIATEQVLANRTFFEWWGGNVKKSFQVIWEVLPSFLDWTANKAKELNGTFCKPWTGRYFPIFHSFPNENKIAGPKYITIEMFAQQTCFPNTLEQTMNFNLSYS